MCETNVRSGVFDLNLPRRTVFSHKRRAVKRGEPMMVLNADPRPLFTLCTVAKAKRRQKTKSCYRKGKRGGEVKE